MLAKRQIALLLSCVLGLAALVLAAVERPSLRQASPDRGLPRNGDAEALIFAEESIHSTSFWLADADNPSVRRRLATIAHAANWRGEAAISPNGSLLAYTLLPAGETDPDHAAQLWLLPTSGGAARRLASDVDLRSVLVWSPDSSSVTFDRALASELQLQRYSLSGHNEQTLVGPAESAITVPVGYSGEGDTLVVARLSASGTDILLLDKQGHTLKQLHAGPSSGRDFTLSAAGTQLAYLALTSETGNLGYTAETVDLTNGAIQSLAQPDAEDVGLVWRPDDSLLIGSANAAGGATDGAGLRVAGGSSILPEQGAGFVQPLAGSRSGGRLAARLFSGSNTAQPGTARDVVIEPSGEQRAISAENPVRFVGWLAWGTHGGL